MNSDQNKQTQLQKAFEKTLTSTLLEHHKNDKGTLHINISGTDILLSPSPDNTIKVVKVKTPFKKAHQGRGHQAMKELTHLADLFQQKLFLEAVSDPGPGHVSREKLTEFYGIFDFKRDNHNSYLWRTPQRP